MTAADVFLLRIPKPKRRKPIVFRRSLRIFFTFVISLEMLLCLCMVNASADDETAQTNEISLTDEEKQFVSSHGTLKVGYVQDRIPISFRNKDGEADGISRYIFDRVSEISGLEFEYEALPLGDVTYDYLRDEGFDLVTSVEYNEENKNAKGILISEPYLSSRKVIVAKNGLGFRYGANLTAAVSKGSQTLKKVLAKMFPSFTLKDYGSIEECLSAVDSGDSDVTIQNQYVVEYWLSKPKYEKLNVIPMIGLDDKLCFSAVVSFGGGEGIPSEDGEMLINILDKAIACMNEDEVGSYIIQGVMENQYEYTFADFISRYRYSVVILVIFIITMLAMAVLFARQRIRFAESRADAKAKGQFLSTMSHEIRTPLNGLMGLNYLMLRSLNEKDKIEEYLKQSSATTKYLLSLVNDILDTSRLEEKKLELVFHPVDLELLIETAGSIEKNAMDDKNIKYTVHSDIVRRYIIGDDVRIQQVLLNLLDNACKFTYDGGNIDLFAKQEIGEDNKVTTIITVSDNGKGMSKEFQEHLFDVFARELETVSKGNQGTGLGLSISRRLAQLMDGDITCVSEKGKGSSFTFTFTAGSTEMQAAEEKKILLPDGILPKILVAEDNELNGEIILELLKSAGFEADIAENGRKALEKFENSPENSFGIILMDLMMPEMDGFETTRAIRALDRKDAKTVKIFACTANSFSEERDKAFDCGMDDFITKPVDIDELLKKLYSVQNNK